MHVISEIATHETSGYVPYHAGSWPKRLGVKGCCSNVQNANNSFTKETCKDTKHQKQQPGNLVSYFYGLLFMYNALTFIHQSVSYNFNPLESLPP